MLLKIYGPQFQISKTASTLKAINIPDSNTRYVQTWTDRIKLLIFVAKRMSSIDRSRKIDPRKEVNVMIPGYKIFFFIVKI